MLSLCTQVTPFKTIWTNFIIVYPVESFQNCFTKFDHCVPNWILSRPFDPILSMCTQLTPFKTIWPHFWSFVYIYMKDLYLVITQNLIKFSWEALCFSWSWTFHWKALCFSWSCAFHWKATKTADSTQISHYDLVFHRVQREGQLGISYILVVFGGACMCIWCMNPYICFIFCIIWFHYGFHEIQHNFTETKMILWDFKWLHEIQLDFTKSNKIS